LPALRTILCFPQPSLSCEFCAPIVFTVINSHFFFFFRRLSWSSPSDLFQCHRNPPWCSGTLPPAFSSCLETFFPFRCPHLAPNFMAPARHFCPPPFEQCPPLHASFLLGSRCTIFSSLVSKLFCPSALRALPQRPSCPAPFFLPYVRGGLPSPFFSLFPNHHFCRRQATVFLRSF